MVTFVLTCLAHGCGNEVARVPHDLALVSLSSHVWEAAVLGVSMVLESVSLVVAIRSVRDGAEAAGLSFWEYVRRGIDPTSVAVMMEDSGAVAGLAVAGGCAT